MIKKLLIILLPSISYGGNFIDRSAYGNLSHLDHRYMNSSIGRFISQDLKKEYKSQYNYTNGNVIIVSDPTGLKGKNGESSDEESEETEETEETEVLIQIVDNTVTSIAEELQQVKIKAPDTNPVTKKDYSRHNSEVIVNHQNFTETQSDEEGSLEESNKHRSETIKKRSSEYQHFYETAKKNGERLEKSISNELTHKETASLYDIKDKDETLYLNVNDENEPLFNRDMDNLRGEEKVLRYYAIGGAVGLTIGAVVGAGVYFFLNK